VGWGGVGKDVFPVFFCHHFTDERGMRMPHHDGDLRRNRSGFLFFLFVSSFLHSTYIWLGTAEGDVVLVVGHLPKIRINYKKGN